MQLRDVTSFAAGLALAAACSSSAAVNKCTTKDGRTVYQDAACENSSAGSQQLRTWNNTPGSFRASQSASREEPSETLTGPPQLSGLLQLYRRWIDAEKLAASTGRIAMAAPVASLQSIYRESESSVVVSCATEAKAALVSLTKQSVESMLQFMQRQELASITYKLLDRPKLVAAFEQSVRLAACKG